MILRRQIDRIRFHDGFSALGRVAVLENQFAVLVQNRVHVGIRREHSQRNQRYYHAQRHCDAA